MTRQDPVLDALEQAAELTDDLSEDVYARFAARCPGSLTLMDHMDPPMRGRMMIDVLTLVMTPPDEIDDGYLRFELDSHRAYGVTAEMFAPLLEAVRDAVAALLGERWTPGMAAAWEARIAALASKLQ
jgi:hypothetical protein